MPRKTTAAKRPEADDEIEDDFMSDEDYFLEELRGAVARARSSRVGGHDLHDNPWGRGLDRLQIDLAD